MFGRGEHKFQGGWEKIPPMELSLLEVKVRRNDAALL